MKPISLSFLIYLFMFVIGINHVHSQALIKTEDLPIRDPFVITDKKENRYLLYKSQSVKLDNGKIVGGVAAYESTDMQNWKGPIQVLQIPEENTLNGGIWAPEVHEYQGHYYIFATINTDKTWKAAKADWPPYQYRSVQIFKADNPLGPFKSFAKDPHLDMKDMTLDGTLWVEKGIPYMIYCHEWVQINDGTMELIALEKDLSKTKGKSKTLFKASEAKWSTGTRHKDQTRSYVTDGCYVYQSKTGELLMIWSSL
ncbi:family 43 glycosylhydrolase [Sphingobacterium sp. HJSM2_6]|uniref:family 43 glycosylhydrolase n=1 Tax=Sphingobacterium sp. HJSM2_6 TaxID=3366264 RepID=UPI003BDA3A34